MKQIFIDRFSIPPDATEEFFQRMNYNRNFIKNLPGFINDTAYERTDENGNLLVITIAVWENEDYLNKAKEKVQTEYKRIGFNPSDFTNSHNITTDRGIYKEIIS